MARYLPSAWNTEEVPLLDAIVIGDGVTWDWSAPAALNSAVEAPLSAKMWHDVELIDGERYGPGHAATFSANSD